MKADALAAQAIADGILYDVGFADGVSSVSVGGISPAQEATDIAAAIAPLNQQITDLELAKTQEDALLKSVQDSVSALAALFSK